MSCAKINCISLLESPAYCLLSIVILPSTLNSATNGHRNYFEYDELHYQGSPDKTLLEKNTKNLDETSVRYVLLIIAYCHPSDYG